MPKAYFKAGNDGLESLTVSSGLQMGPSVFAGSLFLLGGGVGGLPLVSRTKPCASFMGVLFPTLSPRVWRWVM